MLINANELAFDQIARVVWRRAWALAENVQYVFSGQYANPICTMLFSLWERIH